MYIQKEDRTMTNSIEETIEAWRIHFDSLLDEYTNYE